MTLTVSGLNDTHHGRHARIHLTDTDTRQGVLSRARNPSYPRRTVTHWWLIVPSAHPHFTHDALSLQWSGRAVVELI